MIGLATATHHTSERTGGGGAVGMATLLGPAPFAWKRMDNIPPQARAPRQSGGRRGCHVPVG